MRIDLRKQSEGLELPLPYLIGSSCRYAVQPMSEPVLDASLMAAGLPAGPRLAGDAAGGRDPSPNGAVAGRAAPACRRRRRRGSAGPPGDLLQGEGRPVRPSMTGGSPVHPSRL